MSFQDSADSGYIDPLAPIPPKRVDEIVRNSYMQLRARWFATHPEHPAELQILFEEGQQDDYDPEGIGTIRLRFGEGDCQPAVIADFDKGTPIDDIYRATPELWARWRIALVHELCHEWQFKVLANQAHCRGKRLRRKVGPRWDGAGHDDAFYSAIVDFAREFGISAQELARRL